MPQVQNSTPFVTGKPVGRLVRLERGRGKTLANLPHSLAHKQIMGGKWYVSGDSLKACFNSEVVSREREGQT